MKWHSGADPGFSEGGVRIRGVYNARQKKYFNLELAYLAKPL